MKSPLIKIIAKITITVLALGSVFYFMFSPKLSELAQNQIEVSRLSIDLKQADDKLKQLKGYEKDHAALDATKKQVLGLLPDEPSASSFILNIEQTSSSIPIIVESLSVNEIKTAKTPAKTDTSDSETSKTSSSTSSPTTTSSAKPAAEKALTFSASFTSDYDRAQQFLKRMQYLPRFNTIESITLGGYNTTSNTINLKAEGKIYYGK